VLLAGVSAEAADWVRPKNKTDRPVWGIRGHLHFSLWPTPVGGGGGTGGPRGLIQIGYPTLNGGRDPGLVNYIAVEPVTDREPKGYSELEMSELDHVPGKRFWVSRRSGAPRDPAKEWDSGTLTHPDPMYSEVEQLTVTLRMERFANGAHPYLRVSLRSDRPDELELRTFAEDDSATMRECILTATMGNFERLRLLYLKDEVVDCRKLFPGYEGTGFTGDGLFPLDRLARDSRGDVVVALETDESDPAASEPFPSSLSWRWRGPKLTQYWRKPEADVKRGLSFRVNARRVYWMSRQPLPGGLAYENAEFREPYRKGSRSVFGVTRLREEEVRRRVPGGAVDVIHG
jgi:hypothetical protein